MIDLDKGQRGKFPRAPLGQRWQPRLENSRLVPSNAFNRRPKHMNMVNTEFCDSYDIWLDDVCGVIGSTAVCLEDRYINLFGKEVMEGYSMKTEDWPLFGRRLLKINRRFRRMIIRRR